MSKMLVSSCCWNLIQQKGFFNFIVLLFTIYCTVVFTTYHIQSIGCPLLLPWIFNTLTWKKDIFMKRKTQLQNSSWTEWKAVPYFMSTRPIMPFCFMFLPTIYACRYPRHTSCPVRLVPWRALAHAAPPVCSPSLERARRARCRFVRASWLEIQEPLVEEW